MLTPQVIHVASDLKIRYLLAGPLSTAGEHDLPLAKMGV